MKVAVCISGLLNSHSKHTSVNNNLNCARKKFPDYNFHFATYPQFKEDFEEKFPGEVCHYFPEPKVTYHPYEIKKEHWVSNRFQEAKDFIFRGGGKRKDWSSHHVKQHLTHFRLCNIIKDDYDVIVRLRFDSWISRNADFIPYVIDTFENQRTNSFSATKKKKFDELNQFDSSPKGRHYNWMTDQMIIHPASFVNLNLVESLYKEKILHPAEMGWYQILSRPYGNNHRCFDGWVNHDKNVLSEYFYKV